MQLMQCRVQDFNTNQSLFGAVHWQLEVPLTSSDDVFDASRISGPHQMNFFTGHKFPISTVFHRSIMESSSQCKRDGASYQGPKRNKMNELARARNIMFVQSRRAAKQAFVSNQLLLVLLYVNWCPDILELVFITIHRTQYFQQKSARFPATTNTPFKLKPFSFTPSPPGISPVAILQGPLKYLKRTLGQK